MRRVRCANMSSSINENYISIEDAALFLNIKPVTLRKWIKDKKEKIQRYSHTILFNFLYGKR